MNILAMSKSLTDTELNQYNTDALVEQASETVRQIGFEAKSFKFDPPTIIIVCFRAENHQKKLSERWVKIFEFKLDFFKDAEL